MINWLQRHTVQEIEAEDDMTTEGTAILREVKEHGKRYCQGEELAYGGLVEECEREVEAEQEEQKEQEIQKVL
jgi:hypothetical protein